MALLSDTHRPTPIDSHARLDALGLLLPNWS